MAALSRTRALLLCVVTALLVSCRSDQATELVIISPHPPEIKYEFGRAFTAWHHARTNQRVAVRWLDVGGTGEAIEYVRSRNADSAQAGGVDVFFGGGDFPFYQLRKQNLLVPHAISDSILRRIPRKLNGVDICQPDSLWYGAALSSFGVIYNREILRRNNLPTPQHWEDLARRECLGWVSSADPRYSGSVHMMYELLLQAYGWEKGWDVIVRMGGNIQSFSKGASTAAKDVSTGQAAFGLAIDFYAFVEIERYGSDRLGFSMPRGESVVNADGIAMLKGATQPALAASFMDFVLGDGQKLWILKTGLAGGPVRYPLCRFPVDSSLYRRRISDVTVTTNPFALTTTLKYDAQLAGKRRAILADLIAAFVITPHQDLKKCWRTVVESGMTPEQYGPILRIELDEKEAAELATSWNKPEFARKRIELMGEWSRWAIRRYRSARGD